MKNPLYAFVAFLIVEGLVAAGYLNRSDAEFAKGQIEDIVFYIALAATGLVGFHKYIDAHKHQISEQAKADIAMSENETIVKKPDLPTPVFTETLPIGDAGTPPVGN